MQYGLQDESNVIRLDDSRQACRRSRTCLPLVVQRLVAPMHFGKADTGWMAVAQVGVQVLLLWMLYFFTGMALRESVLKVNGSAIRPWSATDAAMADMPWSLSARCGHSMH